MAISRSSVPDVVCSRFVFAAAEALPGAVRLHRLIVFYCIPKPRDSLRERKRFAGKRGPLRAGLAQSRGKRLVHFVIGQAFSLARILPLLGAHCQWRKSLGSLPGTHVDNRLLAIRKILCLALSVEERKVLHGIPGCPGESHAQHQYCGQRKKKNDRGPAESAAQGSR